SRIFTYPIVGLKTDPKRFPGFRKTMDMINEKG
ncbi:MAG: hypothetical protein ACI9FN_003481, partial [Saprospiraceae bacterium]